LPNAIKIDPYNFELYRFKVGAFLRHSVYWQPTNLSFGKFRIAISPQRVIRCTSCLVLGWGFLGRRIKWRYFRIDQIMREE